MPISPPLSNNGELLQHNLHHLVHHNSNTSFSQENYDEGDHQHSRYSSPMPAHDDGYGYQVRHQPRYDYHQHQGLGLGLQYDNYDPNYQSSGHVDRYGTPATSPPTPSINNTDLLRTRSGLSIPRGRQSLRPMPENRARVEKSPKARKGKKQKGKPEKKVAKLEQPLSILTKDWTHVPVVDIDAYVNRSAEVRQKEVEDGKIPGKVKRPMNSFMLYRKAYQNRTKDWCLQNNHQVVSQVCGDSWPLEPDSVKDQFSEWARIERLNHQNAHPGYKFSPTKPGTAKASKRKVSEELQTDESELEDYDWKGTGRRTKKQRQAPREIRQQAPVSYPTTRSAYQYTPSRESSVERGQPPYNASTFQASNPGRPLPAQYQTHLHDGEYYQQSVVNHPTIPGAQDVILKRTSAPGAHSYLGLPGAAAHEYDVMQPYSPYGYQAPEHRIDPSLVAHDQSLYEGGNYVEQSHDGLHYEGSGSHDGDPAAWQHHYGTNQGRHDPVMPYLELEQNQEGGVIHDPQGHVLRGHQNGWQVESLEIGGEFDKWMDDHEKFGQ